MSNGRTSSNRSVRDQSNKDGKRPKGKDVEKKEWGSFRTDKNGKCRVYFCSKFMKNGCCDNKDKFGFCAFPHMKKEQKEALEKKLNKKNSSLNGAGNGADR